MARFLLACYPIAGHLHPNLALAHALRARGHDVGFYSGAAARADIEGEGFAFYPFDKGMDDRIMKVLMPTPGSFQARALSTDGSILFRLRHAKGVLREWFLDTVPEQVQDLSAAIDRWRPDVLVTDVMLFGPIVVLAETMSMPVAVFCVLAACPLPGPGIPTWGRGLPPLRTRRARLRSWAERTVRDWLAEDFRADLDALRARYHLPPLTVTVAERAGQLPLYLVASVPEFDYNRRDLPESVHYIGPCLWHRSERELPPPWLSSLSTSRPVVCVTEGTIHIGRPLVLEAAAAGLSHLPMEVVMTTGKHRDVAALAPAKQAPNVRIERYVAHGDLFPRASVVVTTGGAGTVLSALAAGVPLVVVPTGYDLPENARRVVEAGVGVCLRPRRCTPRRLRAAVERVLHDPAFRRNARRMAAALAAQSGPARGAELLERLAADSAPMAVAGRTP